MTEHLPPPRAPGGGLTPAALDDPLAGLQWHLRRDGLRTAWPRTRGAGVIVAVVDSGVDVGHPDLKPNVWTNPGEIAGNRVDDDANGYVDDVHGYDVVGRDGDPSDEHGHGTHVAGILGARGDDGIGVSGAAPRVKLMAVRALDARNRGNTGWLAAAIDYAVANGARVVNLSINTAADSPVVAAAAALALALRPQVDVERLALALSQPARPARASAAARSGAVTRVNAGRLRSRVMRRG